MFEVEVQELQNVRVAEHDLGIQVELVFPLVLHQHRKEVGQLDRCHLVFIYLFALNRDEFVANIVHEEHIALNYQDMGNHGVVSSLQ